MPRRTIVKAHRRKDGTIVKGYSRAAAKPPRTERGERFLKIAFPNHTDDDYYLDEQRDRLTREPWTWMDLERRRALKQVYPERYAHLPTAHVLYIERYHAKEKGWLETPRFSSYDAMIASATRQGRRYMGYTQFVDGSWIGYYTEEA